MKQGCVSLAQPVRCGIAVPWGLPEIGALTPILPRVVFLLQYMCKVQAQHWH